MLISAPARPEDLFSRFDTLGLRHETHRHRPLFSVADGEDVRRALPGGHSKNLFLKDAKARLWLISALGETQIDLKRLPKIIGSGRLSFASKDLMWSHLGVRPGSVTPFALINDGEHAVTLVLDRALIRRGIVNFHPLQNTATTAMSAEDFLKFLSALEFLPIFVDFRGSQDCEVAQRGPF